MKKRQMIAITVFLGILGVLGFQNCTKVGVSDSNTKNSGGGLMVDPAGMNDGVPPGGNTGNPRNPPGGGGTASDPNNPNSPGNTSGNPPLPDVTNGDNVPEVTGDPDASEAGFQLKCKSVLSSEEGLDLSATKDLNLAGLSGNKVIKAVRNLTIDGASGSTSVVSALNVPFVRGKSGSFVMRALKVGEIGSISGNYCVKADEVKSLVSGSGTAKIKAKTIDLIQVTSGTLYIYGATVARLTENSGTICLQEGAKIVNLDMATKSGPIKENCK